MNRKILSVLFGSILGGFITLVLAFEELDKASLEPMEKPSALPFVSGTEVHWLKYDWFKDGEEFITYYEFADAEMYTVRGDDGSSSTSMTYMFAPALKWNNCDGRSGTQKIIETKGSPWPLSDKTEFQYTFTGKWSDGFGRQWRSTRKCKVDKQVRVKVPAGEYDTYKLVCEDDWFKWTYWISPELGHRVAFEGKDKTYFTGSCYVTGSYMLELVKVVNP